MPASNFNLLNETRPSHLEYLRFKQTNRPVGAKERERREENEEDRQVRRGRRGRGIEQGSGWRETNNEEGEMTGTL